MPPRCRPAGPQVRRRLQQLCRRSRHTVSRALAAGLRLCPLPGGQRLAGRGNAERNQVVAWLAGPGERLGIAKDHRTLFLRPDPGLTDRDYLLHVFGEVAKLPGMAGLFDPRHNPLFQLGPTARVWQRSSSSCKRWTRTPAI